MAKERIAKEVKVAKQPTDMATPPPAEVHPGYLQPRAESVPINEATAELVAEPLKKGHKFYALFRGKEDGQGPNVGGLRNVSVF